MASLFCIQLAWFQVFYRIYIQEEIKVSQSLWLIALYVENDVCSKQLMTDDLSNDSDSFGNVDSTDSRSNPSNLLGIRLHSACMWCMEPDGSASLSSQILRSGASFSVASHFVFLKD